ncbi:MAG TPA: aldolase/citrate lyase family protein [Steroidobacteraceae bacterium]|jgi:2-keto-3-deoxy-L-rhamnonate aldolase RhmA|nr:aldolase/citrate lyase family protein [Steroidobacteraceae bacterium]
MQDDQAPWLVARAAIERLTQGIPVAALGVRSSRTADIARIAKSSGHHALWVDLEHSTMPIDTAASICAAALDLGLAPFVRIPERDYGVIGRLLDGGALGIIAPRVETAEEAQDIIAACRFPPFGHRSAVATLAHLGFQKIPAPQFNAALNRATVVKILLESPRGIENAEAIAALPGVDIVGIGTNDLTAEMGVEGQFRHPHVRKAHESAIGACRRAQKPLAIGGIADFAYAAELIRLGAAPFMFTGIDTDLLVAGARDRVSLALASLKA